jgi:hypothetical protein
LPHVWYSRASVSGVVGITSMDYHAWQGFFFLFLNNLLLSVITRYSDLSCIFPPQYTNQPILQRGLIGFLGKWF